MIPLNPFVGAIGLRLVSIVYSQRRVATKLLLISRDIAIINTFSFHVRLPPKRHESPTTFQRACLKLRALIAFTFFLFRSATVSLDCYTQWSNHLYTFGIRNNLNLQAIFKCYFESIYSLSLPFCMWRVVVIEFFKIFIKTHILISLISSIYIRKQ